MKLAMQWIFGLGLLVGSTAPSAYAASLEEEFTVVGTIYGMGDARAQPVAVIRDAVSKQTLVLRIGECLPRHPRFCLASVDRTEVYATDGRTRLTIHRDPFDAGGSAAAGGTEVASHGSRSGYESSSGGFSPPPPPPPPPVDYDAVPPPGEGGFLPPPPGVNYPAPPGGDGSSYVGAGGGRNAQWVDEQSGGASGSSAAGTQAPRHQKDGLTEMYDFIHKKVQRGERLDPYEEAMLRAQSEPVP